MCFRATGVPVGSFVWYLIVQRRRRCTQAKVCYHMLFQAWLQGFFDKYVLRCAGQRVV